MSFNWVWRVTDVCSGHLILMLTGRPFILSSFPENETNQKHETGSTYRIQLLVFKLTEVVSTSQTLESENEVCLQQSIIMERWLTVFYLTGTCNRKPHDISHLPSLSLIQMNEWRTGHFISSEHICVCNTKALHFSEPLISNISA